MVIITNQNLKFLNTETYLLEEMILNTKTHKNKIISSNIFKINSDKIPKLRYKKEKNTGNNKKNDKFDSEKISKIKSFRELI